LIGKRQYGQFLPAVSASALTIVREVGSETSATSAASDRDYEREDSWSAEEDADGVTAAFDRDADDAAPDDVKRWVRTGGQLSSAAHRDEEGCVAAVLRDP
jgi:hypothetical protein